MSTVDKMLIKGIRSFDPENKNVITFFRPLTLIVGPNGAGKTTIIECLKVACTGEMPPNARSGHSFIHDPKVAGETETKGQIKLRFKTAAGKDVVCIRSFQLTQKATKMEYKAIESVLQTINPHTGEKVCLSYRCADMDREIPALMGVSKAILENVIFVHQDEANWPLQDPSTLKKKFDDIFSATRYTKALEVIKKLHKDQAQEIKTYKLKLENLQTLKDAAYKLRESIAQDKEKTESLKSQMEELEKEIQTLESKIHHAEATLKDLHQLQREIATKTAERKTLFKEQEKQYAALTEENEDTDEELSEWKTKFDERIALLESKISKLEREMNDSETKSSLLKQSITDYIVEISKLQAEAEALAVLKNERDVTIRKLFDRHNLGAVPSGPLSDDVALNLMNRIKLRLAHLDKDLQDKKESNEAEIAAAWNQYEIANNLWNEKEAQKLARADIKNGILKRIEEKENERNEFEREISNVNMAHLDEREKKMQIECERKSKQLAEREFDSNIRQKQTEMFTIDQKLKDLHAEKDRMANESEDRIKLSLKKAELETLKKKHKKLMDDNKDKVKGVLKGRLPSDKDLKKEITQAQSKYNIADGMRQMFDPFERVARAHHICPCCERPFSAEEEDEFVKKQRVKAASSAEHIKVLAMDSSNADSRFQQLDKLRLVYEEYLKVGKESIPLAEKNLNELNEELDHKNQALDDVLGVLAQIKAEKDAVDALIQPVETSDRLFQEIQTLQKQVDDLDYGLDIRGQGIRSMEEIQSELDELQSKRENLSSEVEKLKDDRRYMENEFSSFQLRWFTVREEKTQAANKLNNVKRAEEELDDLVEQKNKVELEEKHLAEAVGPLSKEKDKHFRDYQNLKTKLSKELEEQAEIRRHYQQDVDELKKITSKIREYYELKKEQKLNELQDKRSLSESQLQNCESRKQEISAEVAKSNALMQNQDSLRRNIEDNLNYRKTKAEVDKLTREIELLEDKVLKMGGLSTIEAELKKLSHEREKLLSELNKCHGTLSVYQSSISKNKVDLKQAQYKDIDKRYFDQLIQLKTTEMANKDLDRYYNALDKALMRFHTMKMEEINKIIRELWQQTYRGQDIDYISIHSDSEGSGTRSYSYRVLMQTGDTELEMRGRCSAGQKVLASLIIRLALAETFCLNCGILALDEPTTNLDGPNSESLAAALLRIMEDRKGQENFQLIVITHDERFAQYIGQRQHAEKYYRITKDDHQHSIIEAQEIFD
ncbi:DNA repair protein RAD50 isoform X2 [Nicotiana tomentosiformis]|uniref:DNA repair protein RAD50 isoform X2 n=1 Tax=Nicotiana tomentosiformis TaxID=4098 RepID=UPI00388C3E98